MEKLANWDTILIQKIRDTYTKKFEWGVTDCAKWSFDVVNSIVKETVEPPVTWNNKAEALTLLKEKSLKDRMTEIFGEPQRLGLVMRGDFVYIDDLEGGPTIGIAAGDKAVFISSKGGIVTKDILSCDYSWSIN